MFSTNCVGVHRAKGETKLITDASDVGGGANTLYQWQELHPPSWRTANIILPV